MLRKDPIHNFFGAIGILTIIFLLFASFSYEPMQFFTLVSNGWISMTQFILG